MGAIHLYYADALSAIGDIEATCRHYAEAERHCWQEAWKKRAREGIEASGKASARSAESRRAPCLPSQQELYATALVFRRREQRAVVYDVSASLLEQALTPGSGLSVAVPVATLLHSWNFAYYGNGRRRFDARHFADIEGVLVRHQTALQSYRLRDIASFIPDDEPAVIEVFSDIERVVNRVGAAKTIHLWAPTFFPLWDNPIAAAYGFDFHLSGSKAQEYCLFMRIVQNQMASMRANGTSVTLKALDVFNYVRFSKPGWKA